MKDILLVMAGGQGTRFWPESTKQKPKQYLSLTGNQSLLSNTLERFKGCIEEADRYVVTVDEQKSLVQEHSDLAKENIIIEPAGRNTAPCIFLSLVELQKAGVKPQDRIAVVPSDHVILNRDGFQKTLKKAFALATEKEGIVTIGIPPHFPHTGFGYIQKGSDYKIKSFCEKPDRKTAEEYLSSGEYLWNAGMFVASWQTLWESFQNDAPEIFKYSGQLPQEYDKLEKISFDYAIMEKSQKTYVIPAEFDWNDLGSWDALEEVIKKTQGNTFTQKPRVLLTEESEGNIIHTNRPLVALLGVKDLVVIENEKSLVVFPKKRSQEVKKLVDELKKRGESEFL